MVVYSQQDRKDDTPIRAMETQAAFYDRVAGTYWDQVRDTINEWWSHLPVAAQSGMACRLRDKNSDANVWAAQWELYLHEMLLGSGCTVEIEPQIGTRGKRPDFLVTRGDEQFVVEAAWRPERLAEDVDGMLTPQLTDAINGVTSPNFLLAVSVEETGPPAPPLKRLRSELTRWLADLDPDQVSADHQDHGHPWPRHVWEERDWRLTFDAIPRRPDRRGLPSARAIGIYPAIGFFRTRTHAVLDAVKEKGNKYGDMPVPYIIAVGDATMFTDDEDIESDLYGRSVEYMHAGAPSTFGRLADGYWATVEDNGHARVSGALVVKDPSPPTWTKQSPVLWLSPDTRSRPAPVLPAWATARLVDDHVERRPAVAPICTTIGLPEQWPAGRRFPRATR
jgi:hypothetical protein